jgi:hypothetical protein
MPPGLRRKSMAVGTRAAITMASCPAPLGIIFSGKPAASIASARNEPSAVRPSARPADPSGVRSQSSPRAAIASACASSFSTGSACAADRWRGARPGSPLHSRNHVARIGLHDTGPPWPPGRRSASASASTLVIHSAARPVHRGAGAWAWCRRDWRGR